MALTNEEVLKFVKAQSIEMVDFKVVDLFGRWHHVTIPASQLSKSTFTDGIGIDASGSRFNASQPQELGGLND